MGVSAAAGAIVVSLVIAISALAGASLAALQGADKAYGCSCAQLGSPQEELGRASGVFSGRVLSVEGDDRAEIATFDVDRVWKGDFGRAAAVSTQASGDACGYPFEEGQWYVVYVHGDGSSNDVSLCSRTAPFSEAGEDIVALGEGHVRAAQTTVSLMTPDPPYMNEIALQRIAILAGAVGAAAAGLTTYLVKRRRKENKGSGSG